MSQFQPSFIQKAMIDTAMNLAKQYATAMHDAGRMTNQGIEKAMQANDLESLRMAIRLHVESNTIAHIEEQLNINAALLQAGNIYAVIS